MDSVNLLSCDIVCTRGYSLVSRVIRVGQLHPNDTKSVVNHVGMIIDDGPLNKVHIIEARATVLNHSLYNAYHGKQDKLTVFRPIGLSEDEKSKIVMSGLAYEGKDYGYLKIAAHFLDFLSGGRYIFRRLTNNDNYPICSWVVSHSYASIGLAFGCDPGQANPDDIFDFCDKHEHKYQKILDCVRI